MTIASCSIFVENNDEHRDELSYEVVAVRLSRLPVSTACWIMEDEPHGPYYTVPQGEYEGLSEKQEHPRESLLAPSIVPQ